MRLFARRCCVHFACCVFRDTLLVLLVLKGKFFWSRRDDLREGLVAWHFRNCLELLLLCIWTQRSENDYCVAVLYVVRVDV